MTRRFVAFLYCVAGLTIAIPASTLAIIGLLPASKPAFSPQLAPGVEGLPEFRDRVTVVAWILLTSVAGVTAWYAARPEHVESRSRSATLQRILIVLSTITMLSSLLWRWDPAVTYNVKQLTLTELIVTSIICVVILVMRQSPRINPLPLVASWRPLQPLLAGVLFVLLFPTYFQTPLTLRDPGHFMYVADETLAPTVGKWPLSDYLSQYSNLLGFPIIPFVRLFDGYAVTVVVMYLVTLQLLCILTPAFMAVIAGQRHLAIPLVAIPAVFCMPFVYTYFQILPLRTVMPCLILVVTVVAATRTRSKFLWITGVGVTTALAVLNNPDFGLFALIASVVSLILSETTFYSRLKILFGICIGVVAGITGVALTYQLFNHTLRFDYLFLFQQVFGEAGYFNAPVALGGLPITLVTIFGISVLTAVYANSRARELRNIRYVASATQLMFSSLWGLFSSIYFAGRSFSSTALGGYALPFGLTVSGLIIYVAVDYTHILNQIRAAGRFGTVLMIPAFGVLSLLVMAAIRMPSLATSFDHLAKSGTDFIVERTWQDQLFVDDYEILTTLGLLNDSGQKTGLLLPSSNALELKTGLHSVLISNHPGNARVSRVIADLQCEALLSSGLQFFIEENISRYGAGSGYRSQLNVPRCQELFAFRLRVIYESPTLRILENAVSSNE